MLHEILSIAAKKLTYNKYLKYVEVTINSFDLNYVEVIKEAKNLYREVNQ